MNDILYDWSISFNIRLVEECIRLVEGCNRLVEGCIRLVQKYIHIDLYRLRLSQESKGLAFILSVIGLVLKRYSSLIALHLEPYLLGSTYTCYKDRCIDQVYK